MFGLLKLILNIFSDDPKLPLIPKVEPSLNIKKLLNYYDDEILS